MNPNDRDIYDVTIIGGGPVGLFTAFYSGMRELKTKVIEHAEQLGGKVNFYPDKLLHDIGGIAAITGAEFIEQSIIQGRTFNPTIELGQRIEKLEMMEDGVYKLSSHTGPEHYTRTLIIAIGSGIFVPRKLEQAGAERFEEQNLHYAVDSVERFRGKHVLISGGGNSAVDWANALEPIASKVTVVHRRDEFGGLESNVTRMRKSSVELITPYALKEVHGENERIERVTLTNVETDLEIEFEVDELLVNHGITADLGGIKQWGLVIEEDRIIVDPYMKTNLPGVFAAGDVANFPGKLRLIAGGYAEGPLAINSAKAYLEPDVEVMKLYSTHHDKLIAMHKKTSYSTNN